MLDPEPEFERDRPVWDHPGSENLGGNVIAFSARGRIS